MPSIELAPNLVVNPDRTETHCLMQSNTRVVGERNTGKCRVEAARRRSRQQPDVESMSAMRRAISAVSGGTSSNEMMVFATTGA